MTGVQTCALPIFAPVSIYLAHAPFLKILAYTVLLLVVMLGTYALGSRKLLKENIIDALKDETF